MLPWKIITDDEVEDIHLASLRLLHEVGVVLGHPKTRDILLEAGAVGEGERLRMPPDMVEKALSQCGGNVRVKGRSIGEVILGDGNLHWHNLGGARDVFEPGKGSPRPATVQDVRDATRVLDALDGATTITPFFTPQDVPGGLMSLAMYRYALPHTTKPLQGPGVQVAKEVRYIVEMAEIIGPAEEILTLSVSPISPLTFPKDLTGAMVEIAEYGIPFAPLPCPTAGTTAPLSLAGALTQQNAELLASIVIVQSINSGLPIIYCGRLAMMEPRTGISVWGGVELGIASAATVQIGHRYDFPVNVYGLSTNAHVLDIQSGYERALNAIIPALAGADELSGIGEMEAGVMGSYAQMVCDDDIISSINRARRGFIVNDESLAIEVIGEVMNGPRNFLGEKHTIQFLEAGEILNLHLGDRQPFDRWDQSGRQGMAERASAEAERILANHEVVPLSTDQEHALDEIMRIAEAEFEA